jgi:hypothetical protein
MTLNSDHPKPFPRYLTKSRFKLATECPTKLFYTGKAEYADQSLEDAFLAALAEGGFQVGALAKAMYPDGIAVEAMEQEAALAETAALMEREKVTIFEAAFRFNNLFIRIDILQKQGHILDLIEVKAQSIAHKSELIGKRSGKIAPTWKPHLMDVAFQEHVLRKVFPEAVIRPRLMLADKTARTSVDGLNQRFKLTALADHQIKVECTNELTPENLGTPILTKINVHSPVKLIKEASYRIGKKSYDFNAYIETLAAAYETDTKISPHVDCATCGKCSFTTTTADELEGKQSGFKACWTEAMKFSAQDFEIPNVMDLWKCTQKETFRKTGRFFLRDLREHDFDTDKPTGARQWLQVRKTVADDLEPWIDLDGLHETSSTWTWPLHFIDFETSAVAIPFTRERHPYEMMAFQFSHHVVHEDGRIEHADEYLNTESGAFPNIEFLRRLKASLEQDEGTIFRYAAHENTVLNQILQQLLDSQDDIPDRPELIEWIQSITQNTTDEREGPRNMIDLCELVKKYYYQRDMGGSNSIKKVLPAILNSSKYLQEKYSQPIYNSANFQNHTWIQYDEAGRVRDPYKLLPPIFTDRPQEDREMMGDDDRLTDGGAAMTAYARLQFSDTPDAIRLATRQALLRYCELDTLAMVMIWEAWAQLLKAD